MGDRITVEPIGVQDLSTLDALPFDAVYSDLGPLNCAIDLESAAGSIAGLLKSRGRLIVSVIGRSCPWEFLYYALHGDLDRARLRHSRDVVPVGLSRRTVWMRYYSPQEFYRAFQDRFDVTGYRGLNLFLPPPYLLRDRWRAIYRALGWLDDRLGALPVIREGGDHFLMVLTARE